MSGSDGSDSRIARLELALAIGCTLAIVAPLLGSSVVPTHDGFQHLLHGVLWNHLEDPARGYATFVERGSPITAWGFTWLFGPLESALGWERAYQSVLAIIAAGFGWAFRAVVHAVAGRRSPLGLLGFACAFSWPFYMGFLPFLAATAVGLAGLAIGVGRHGGSLVGRVATGAVLLLCAMMHVFPAVLCGGALLVLRAASVGREPNYARALLGELGLIALTGAPAALVALLAFGAGADNVASQDIGGENRALWFDWGTRLANVFATGIAGPAWRSVPVTATALVGAVLGLRGARRGRAKGHPQEGRVGRAAAVVGLGCFAAATLLPFHMSAWEFLSPRPLMLGLCLGVAAGATALDRRTDAWVIAAAALLTASSLAWALPHNAKLARGAQVALAAVDETTPHSGWRLPIVYDAYGTPDGERVAYAKPLANIGFVYAAAEGGMVPYLFASSPRIHQHLFRSDAPAVRIPDRSYFDATSNEELLADPRRLDALRQDVLRHGVDYADVIIVGDAATVRMAESRGFVVEAEHPGVATARYVGCPMTLEWTSPPSGPVAVEWGWFPLDERDGARTVLPGQTATIPTACGDVWLRIVAADGATCHGAIDGGRIIVRATPDMTSLRCALVGP